MPIERKHIRGPKVGSKKQPNPLVWVDTTREPPGHDLVDATEAAALQTALIGCSVDISVESLDERGMKGKFTVGLIEIEQFGEGLRRH